MKILVFVVLAASAGVSWGHGVATSHQSVISGEGWRYGYGIAHGPPGIGHAVGESFPHGYGGFGTYAPAFGYGAGLGPHLPPSVVPVVPRPILVGHLPPRPIVLVHRQGVLPQHPRPLPLVPLIHSNSLPLVSPYASAYLSSYFDDDADDDDDDHHH